MAARFESNKQDDGVRCCILKSSVLYLNSSCASVIRLMHVPVIRTLCICENHILSIHVPSHASHDERL